MGKYSPLTKWFLKSPADSVRLTFAQLEGILGFKLPESAYTHSAWWMNDIHHSQAKGWLEAGYITASSNQPVSTHMVEFLRKSMTESALPVKVTPVKRHNPAATRLQKATAQDPGITIGEYRFFETPFIVLEKDIPSPFLQYDGHTVIELLDKKHYSSLSTIVEEKYPRFLHERIRCFMEWLVWNSDPFYLRFLNRNGNDCFCRFKLTDKSVLSKKGIYLYEYNDEITYIGRCRDNYNRRFNLNYGSIQPVNCYKGGQSTNAHMNSLINRYGDGITIYLCLLTNDEEIIAAEGSLIKQLQPAWNQIK